MQRVKYKHETEAIHNNVSKLNVNCEFKPVFKTNILYHNKKDFAIEKQLARRILKYTKYLSYLPYLLCNSNI